MYLSFLIAQTGVPIALLLWQGWQQPTNQLSWLLKTSVVAAYLGAITLIGLWPIALPWWLPALYWLVWLGQAALTFGEVFGEKHARWPQRRAGVIAQILVCGALIGLFSVLALQAASGYVPPAQEPVSLEFPFKNGTYYVFNGGNSELINPHLKTLHSQRFRAYRGQSYAVDIVKLNRWGTRASGFLPKALERYEIYGETVYAPCAGKVIATANTVPEMIPPQPDRKHIPGNHVLLQCGEIHVLLAHFRQGGVKVAPGEAIALGQPVGEIGNSGNTNEPHLHIHAQKPGSQATPLDGEPLPILFGDRYLVRNARIQR